MGKLDRKRPTAEDRQRDHKLHIEWVLEKTNFKRNGFFVEMGAVDGVKKSNTLILEQDYGWTGILAEPDPRHHIWIKYNRPNSSIEFDCVWNQTGMTKKFVQSRKISDLRSTLADFAGEGLAPRARNKWSSRKVNTISLLDMLDKHNAPKYIDYFSLDTEGSEYQILKTFDFSKYKFGLITVEWNHHNTRGQKILDLLTSNGYYIPEDSKDIFEFDYAFVNRDISD